KMNLLFLLFACGAHAAVNSEYYYLTVGSFQHLCLGFNDNSAYVENQCIIARQEAGRDVSSAKTYCQAFEPFGKQIKGFLFAARDEEHMKAVENRRIMNQSGSYIVADNGKGATLAVPASGKKDNIGFMCAFKDNTGCPTEHTRFRDKCYKSMGKMTFDDAVARCKVSEGKGSLPKVEDDDLNQFLADMAAEKFKSEKGKKTLWVNGVPPSDDEGWAYSNSQGQTDGGPVTFFRWWFPTTGVKIVRGQNPVLNFERESCEEGVKFGYWTVESVS
ncbi:hypothetical protein PFISCL1PPCAC_21136, partial [Pristionchus fissidentatus]